MNLDAEHAPDQRQALWEPDAFRADPSVQFTASEMPIAASFGFTAVETAISKALASSPLSSYLAWWAGVPVGLRDDPRPWPRDAEGVPLAHVLQVCLSSERGNHRGPVFDKVGLPADGILQVFHDLVTYGGDGDWPRDDASIASGWEVRWLPFADGQSRDGLELLVPPVDLPPERRADHQQLNTEVFATVPSGLDLPEGFVGRDRYFKVQGWLEECPHYRNSMRPDGSLSEFTPWQDGYEPSLPVTRMRGYGFVERNPDYESELAARLPLATDDSHVLLFELNPYQFESPGDWFHGLRPLQVWIRASDLEERRYDRVWCLIRTDAFGG